MKNPVITNRKAAFDYVLFDSIEAGIELKGAEVKSIRQAEANLKDSFVRITDNQAYVYGMHISPYKQSGQFAPDPTRTRKLLLHKAQIQKLASLTSQKGYTVIPIKAYFKKGKVKLEIAVAKGKRFFDKREKLREKQVEREIQRSFKSRGSK
ncbi:MAG: SsrA-binding protein SmpB [Candidatus Omnitrophota bacterium]